MINLKNFKAPGNNQSWDIEVERLNDYSAIYNDCGYHYLLTSNSGKYKISEMTEKLQDGEECDKLYLRRVKIDEVGNPRYVRGNYHQTLSGSLSSWSEYDEEGNYVGSLPAWYFKD